MTPASSASWTEIFPSRSAERAVLATVALGTMLAPLNSTMLAVALPSIMADLGADLATAGWLVTAYLIAMAAIQPVAGSLGDRLGRRRLILGGLAWFGLASLGATVAPSLPALLLFRVQQALAGAIALPNATALVREVVPADRRAARFGQVGAAIALAAAAGPPLGGLLVDAWGWRSIFYANVPLVAAALLIGWTALSADQPRQAARAFDLGGAIGLSVVLAGAAAVLSQYRALGTEPAIALAILVLVGAALLLRHERRHPAALLRPDLFGRRAFAAANAAVGLSNLAMYVTLLAVPLFLAARPDATGGLVGFVLAPLSVMMVVCSPIGGRLADRLGRRAASVTGLALLPLGALPLALGIDALPLAGLIVSLGLLGAGLGLSTAPIQTVALEAVEPHEAGVAAGIFSTSRYLGSILGSILLAALVGAQGTAGRFDGVFQLVLLASILAVLAALTLGRSTPAAAHRNGVPGE